MWQQTIYDYMKHTKRTAFVDYKDAIILFDFENYWAEIESLDKLRKNPWTPIEIAEKLSFLHFVTFETDTNKIQNMPAIAMVVLNRSKAFVEKKKNWGVPQKLQDDLQISLGDYFNEMEATIIYIEKWLNKYSEHKINLNF